VSAIATDNMKQLENAKATKKALLSIRMIPFLVVVTRVKRGWLQRYSSIWNFKETRS
jgi:hypothetical protein